MVSSTSASAAASQSEEPVSFTSELPAKEKSDLQSQLQAFVVRHASHHRPVALVTSGGTAVDLEVNSVRCLDNFSTGLRGAISVEEFLKRGYAVIHLWRRGSASPYGRVLSQCLGIGQANHGLSVESLGQLFAGEPDEEDQEDEMVKAVLEEEMDPWLTDPSPRPKHLPSASIQADRTDGGLCLHRRLVHSSRLQRALRARSPSLREGKLLTVPFRTVEEYLAKLQLCSEALRDSQSLAILYLAAAVSDFYVPASLKSMHKIQSEDDSKVPGLVLKLHPVPKVLGVLRKSWAPDAFVVSFKLETDKSILRRKAERAVQRYGVHMVIGNLLKSRHERVSVLHGDATISLADWSFREIIKPSSSGTDALEEALIDFVLQQHFDYISRHWNDETSNMPGTEVAIRTHERLRDKKRQIERDLYWRRVRNIALEVAGSALGVAITWIISTTLTKRIHLHSSH